MTTLTHDHIKNTLREKICTVVFLKKDKTERTMMCTLMSSYIKDNDLVPSGGGTQGPVDQVRVVDTEINQWRSFNLSTVLSFE